MCADSGIRASFRLEAGAGENSARVTLHDLSRVSHLSLCHSEASDLRKQV
jgi:hypothetical protein